MGVPPPPGQTRTFIPILNTRGKHTLSARHTAPDTAGETWLGPGTRGAHEVPAAPPAFARQRQDQASQPTSLNTHDTRPAALCEDRSPRATELQVSPPGRWVIAALSVCPRPGMGKPAVDLEGHLCRNSWKDEKRR